MPKPAKSLTTTETTMKKTILTIALLTACAAFANGKAPPSRDYCEPKAPSKPEPKAPEPKAPEPKAPDVKTPSKPDTGPKAPSTPTESRSQSRSDAHDRPCDRPEPPFWCPKPVVPPPAEKSIPEPLPAAGPTVSPPPVAPLPEPVQVITVVVREACTEVKFFPPEKKVVKKKAVQRKPVASTSCAMPKL